MNLKLKVIWCIAKQQTFCHKVVSLFCFFFCLFFVEEERWPIQVVGVLDPSIFIGNEMEDGNVRFSMKRKRQCSRIAFCVNLSQVFVLSYLTTPWMMLLFKNSCALLCFSSTIGKHTDTAHLIEWLFSNETVTH